MDRIRAVRRRTCAAINGAYRLVVNPMYSERKIAGVILAAGCSSRMLGLNKLTVSIEGTPAIVRVCCAALESALSPVIIVLGHEGEQVRGVLTGGLGARAARIRVLVNPRYRDGRLSSVAAGLGAVPASCGAAMFLRGDQPWVTSELIGSLLDTYRERGASVAFPVHRGRKGSPTVFGRCHFHRLLALTGDHGTLDLAEELWDGAAKLEVDDPRCLMGIDTPEDLRRLLAGEQPSGKCEGDDV